MATLTNEQLKDSYQSLVTIGDSITSNPTSGVLENGLGNPINELQLTSNSSATVPSITIKDTDTTLVTNQTIGRLNFEHSDTDNAGVGAKIEAVSDFNNGNTRLSFFAGNPTSLDEKLRIKNTGDIIFFDDADNEAFYWDADVARLGIGTTSPDSNLVVNGSSNVRINLKASDVRYGTIFADSGIVAVSSITSIPLVLGTNDTERIRILSSGGLTFNGDTAQANALDDYEEGTWTPTLASSGGSGSATYTSQLGTYTKIGRQVVVQFFITFQENTLSGGTLQMQGFPFTSQANLYPESAILFDNLATALSNPLIQIGASTTIADLIQGNGGTSPHAGLDIDTYLGTGTMNLRGTITYFV